MTNLDENAQYLAKLKKLIGYIQVDMKNGNKSGGLLKKKARLNEIFIICLSAIVTILLGIDVNDYPKWLYIVKNTTVIFSAVVTSFHTWNAFANYNARSIQEQTFVNKLSLLYKDINLYIEENNNCKVDEYNNYKNSYDRIHEEYLQERTPNDKENEKKDST